MWMLGTQTACYVSREGRLITIEAMNDNGTTRFRLGCRNTLQESIKLPLRNVWRMNQITTNGFIMLHDADGFLWGQTNKTQEFIAYNGSDGEPLKVKQVCYQARFAENLVMLMDSDTLVHGHVHCEHPKITLNDISLTPSTTLLRKSITALIGQWIGTCYHPVKLHNIIGPRWSVLLLETQENVFLEVVIQIQDPNSDIGLYITQNSQNITNMTKERGFSGHFTMNEEHLFVTVDAEGHLCHVQSYQHDEFISGPFPQWEIRSTPIPLHLVDNSKFERVEFFWKNNALRLFNNELTHRTGKQWFELDASREGHLLDVVKFNGCHCLMVFHMDDEFDSTSVFHMTLGAKSSSPVKIVLNKEDRPSFSHSIAQGNTRGWNTLHRRPKGAATGH